MTEVASRIFTLVKAQKITQKEFAERCGVSEKVISQWKGDSQSYKKYLPQIADALNTTVGYIVTGNTTVKEGFSQSEIEHVFLDTSDHEHNCNRNGRAHRKINDEDGLAPHERELLAYIRSRPPEDQPAACQDAEAFLRFRAEKK